MQIRPIFYAMAIAIMGGWLLYVGRSIFISIIAAVISLYLLSAAADGLGRMPLVRHTPAWARRTLVLVGFAAAVVLLFGLIATSFEQVLLALPRYQANLESVITRSAGILGLAGEPNWERMRAFVDDEIDLRRMAAWVVGSTSSLGSTVFLVVLYAAFLLAERHQFERKLTGAVRDAEDRERARAIIGHMNERIGNYLVVKTVVNVILGVVSLAIMWVIGIEFAVFWAVLIGFLNYIPYVGSLIGVIFPVLLSLAQFGSITVSVLTLVALSLAQIVVGSVVEPRMMSRAFNLSAFVVLVSLSVWTSLWGVPGAILAVPMTSILVIVLAEIDGTRPVAIMLSANGRI